MADEGSPVDDDLDRYDDDPHYQEELGERVSGLLGGVLRRVSDIRWLITAASVDASRLRAETHPAFRTPLPGHFFTVGDSDMVLREEAEQGFPTYHGLAALGLWSLLEAFADDVCFACLEYRPDFLSEQALQVKVPLKDLVSFAALDEEAQRQYLFESLGSISSSAPSHGKDRLERRLRAFGVQARGKAELRTGLLEFYAVRNVLAHRDGRVDAQFLELCPWSGLSAGDKLRVTDAKLDYYARISMHHATLVTKTILDRVQEHAPHLATLLEIFEIGAPSSFVAGPAQAH